MIQSLKELVTYLDKDRRKVARNPQFIGITGKRKELYALISANDQIDEDALLTALYPQEEVQKKSFKKLQDRLYENLIDTVLSLQRTHEVGTGYRSIRERCIKQASVLKVLLFNGLVTNVIELSKKLINTCKRYEFYDILLDVLFINLELYGRGYQDKKMFNKYSKLYDRTKAIDEIEKDVQLKYYRLFVDYSTSQQLKDEKSIRQLEHIRDVFQSHLEGHHSIKCDIVCLNALTSIAEIFNNYHDVVRYVDNALHYLKGKPQNNRLIQLSFLHKKLRANLKWSNKSGMMETLLEIEKRSEKHSLSNYLTALHKCLMWSHEKKYDQVLNEILKVYDAGLKKNAPDNIREYVEVIYGYMAFLAAAGHFDHEHFNEKKFRVYRFLNQVPNFSKDKKGVNIAILILHILFLLDRRKYNEIIDRMDALKLYTYRYLRKDDTFRSNCFIRMLLEMIKADFHPIRTARYTSDLRERLSEVPLELSEQPLEVEIIPYENLWEVVMDLLERNQN